MGLAITATTSESAPLIDGADFEDAIGYLRPTNRKKP